jgi:hypothetical protein
MNDPIASAILRHRRWSRLAVVLEAKVGPGNDGPLLRLGAGIVLWPVRLLRRIALHRLLSEHANNIEQARQKFFYIAALMMSAKLELNGAEIARVTLTLGEFRPHVLR